MGWSSFPPEHKKSFYIGLGLYVFLVCACGGWIRMNASSTLQEWHRRTLQAEATVNMAYPGDSPVAIKSGSHFHADSAAPLPQGAGSITIVMTGLGLSQDTTKRVLEQLPANITVAFSPYSPSLQDWLKEAQKQNRQKIILVPMEPLTYPKDDPGPLALLTRQSRDDNAQHLAFILNNAADTNIVMNQMGSAFLGNAQDMRDFFATLKTRHDLFIENSGAGSPQAALLAAQSDVPYLSADMTIDSSVNPLEIHQKLLDLEKIARKRGYALGIARPYPLTIDILKDWAGNLDNRGITLVAPAALEKIKKAQPPPAPEETKPLQPQEN